MTWGEEEVERWREVEFDAESFRHFWRGYLSQAHPLLSDIEYDTIYDALFIIAFEMGLRFFTDYLNGDTYFKIHYPKNNLYRGLVQLRLAESIFEQKEVLRQIIADEQLEAAEKTIALS